MGWQYQCLSIESILLKYHFQPPSCLSTYTTEGKFKIMVEINPQSEEVRSFYECFIPYFVHLQTFIYGDFVEQNCHVFVNKLFPSDLLTHVMEENLNYFWKQTRNLKKLHTFIPYFVHLGTFIETSLTGNIHGCLGRT